MDFTSYLLNFSPDFLVLNTQTWKSLLKCVLIAFLLIAIQHLHVVLFEITITPCWREQCLARVCGDDRGTTVSIETEFEDKPTTVEAMSSKVILMMPKNQESSKIQRFKNQVSKIKIQDSTIKFQESRFKNNQDQDSRLKTQDLRIKRKLNQDKY